MKPPGVTHHWQWLTLAPAVVVVLTVWCYLHGLALGGAAVGLDVSLPWASKSVGGWALAWLLLDIAGARVLRALRINHRWLAAAVLTAAVLSTTLSLELWILRDDTTITLWLYNRLPLHVPLATLLVAAHLLLSSRKPVATPITPAASSRPMVEVMTGTGRTQIRLADIECLEADRNYISVHTPQKTYLLRQTLASLEKSLESNLFLRVHRSTIVNRAMIRERRPGGVLVLSSGRTVKVSRGRRWSG
jgi:DNA-binding LytR/AlgR family response regulator